MRILLPGLFFATILAVQAWFSTGSTVPKSYLHFEVRHTLDGWDFVPETVGEKAQAILATTNLFNGAFFAPDGRRVTVFAADWRADSPEAMSVVQHTPDICWVGAGMQPAQLGQPERVMLRLGDRETPFECRVFGTPRGTSRELVLWCTIVSGAVLPEPSRWSIEDNHPRPDSEVRLWSARRVAIGQFLGNVVERRRGIGAKQFVRFSTPIADGWENAVERLKAFAPLWLDLRVTEN
jgi:hypothetical protein